MFKKLKFPMEFKKLNVGGQALIEGVMIRGPYKYVAAVRKKSRIISKEGRIPSRKYAFMKLPFIRGFVNLVDMLVIGIRSLMWSAEQAAPKDEKIGKNELVFTIFISIGFAIIFFIALPYFLTNLMGLTEEKKPILFFIIAGCYFALLSQFFGFKPLGQKGNFVSSQNPAAPLNRRNFL